MRTAGWFVMALYLMSTSAVAQLHPDTRVYRDERFGFEFTYPAAYRPADLPCTVAQSYASFGYQQLVNLHSAEQNASIRVSLDRRRFNEETVKYFHNRGDDTPEKVKFGQNMFYYYGRGGGGVDYPDEYFYNLDGAILEISFDGPYINDNTPAPTTKNLEKQLLTTFKRLK